MGLMPIPKNLILTVSTNAFCNSSLLLFFVIAIDQLEKLPGIATEKGSNAKQQGRAVADDLHHAKRGRCHNPCGSSKQTKSVPVHCFGLASWSNKISPDYIYAKKLKLNIQGSYHLANNLNKSVDICPDCEPPHWYYHLTYDVSTKPN